MRIGWLVCTVESKAYLRGCNVVGVRWCMYSCNCTWIYIGKLNAQNKIMSLHWSNNWEPNIFNGQHQYTILSLLAHRAVGVQDLDWLCPCYLHFLPTTSETDWRISLFMIFMTPVSLVLLDVGCWPLWSSHSHALLPSSSLGPKCTVTTYRVHQHGILSMSLNKICSRVAFYG